MGNPCADGWAWEGGVQGWTEAGVDGQPSQEEAVKTASSLQELLQGARPGPLIINILHAPGVPPPSPGIDFFTKAKNFPNLNPRKDRAAAGSRGVWGPAR